LGVLYGVILLLSTSDAILNVIRQPFPLFNNSYSDANKEFDYYMIIDRKIIETRFQRVCTLLDNSLDRDKSKFTEEGIILEDFLSNRSGFDWSGFPNYVWEYRFKKEKETNSLIEVAFVSLKYIEPIEESDSKELKMNWQAERFYRGAESHFLRRGTESILNVDFDGDYIDLFNLINVAMDLASKALVV
jgi:hypothetical protein